LWLTKINGNCSVYNNWLPGPLTYLSALWKGSLFDTSALRELLVSNVDLNRVQKSNVAISIGVCSLNTGKFLTVDGNEPLLIDYIMASSSFPVAFPSIEIHGEIFTDGGIRNAAPISRAIENGVSEIDIILNNPISAGVPKFSNSQLTSILAKTFRTIDILSDEVLVSELESLCAEKNISLRIHAPKKFFDKHALHFDKEHVQTLLTLGYTDL